MPKFGDLLATDVWAAAARTLTDFSAEEIFDLPIMDSIYPGVALTSSASANTFGSWVEISADIGVGKRLIAVSVVFTDTNGTVFEIEIGEGANPNEAAVARVEGSMYMGSAAGFENPAVFYLWKSLTDNARITARVKDGEAAGRVFWVAAMVA